MKKKYIKVLLITLSCVIIQSLLYLLVKTIQGSPILISSEIDSKVTFNVLGIIPYTIWYAFLFIIPIIIYKNNKEDFVKYIVLYLSISVVADIIFALYPTYVIRPELTNNGILYGLTRFVYSIDEPAINCLPSLHCAVATIWIIYSFTSKKIDWKIKISIVFTSILIMISTVLIKQHAIIDTIAGISLTIVVYFIMKTIKIDYSKILNILNL